MTARVELDPTTTDWVQRATAAVNVWHSLGIATTGERLEAQRLPSGKLAIKVSAFRGAYDTLPQYVERWTPWFPAGWRLGRSGDTPTTFAAVFVEVTNAVTD